MHEAFDSERLPTSAIITTGEKYVIVKQMRGVMTSIHMIAVEPIKDLQVHRHIFMRFERYPTLTKRVYKSDEYQGGMWGLCRTVGRHHATINCG